MAIVINTNVDSIKIQHNLTGATNKMSQTMQRMSTGLKVLTSKDDAAGAVIAARMKVQLDGNATCQNNVQNGNAMLSTAEGNLDVIENNLSRIRDLTLQAKNGTYSLEEVQAMQDEVAARIAEIDRISTSAKYSQLKLFDDTEGLQKVGATLQVGANSDKDNTIDVDKSLFASVKFADITTLAADFDLTALYGKENYDVTPADPDAGTPETTSTKAGSYAEAIEKLDKGLDNITQRKSIIGSAQNRLESALNTLTTQQENLSEAKSIITDADIASEASSYTQQSILQQVSTSLLAQANQAPSLALSLI